MKKKGVPKAEAADYYNLLILEVTYHLFCCILLVTQTNPDTMWEQITQGCEYLKQGSLGAILEAG